MHIDGYSGMKRDILHTLKKSGPSSITDLQESLHMTGEGLRKHLVQLLKDGVVDRESITSHDPLGGRPKQKYALTIAGENIFPKHYDQIAVELIDEVSDRFGQESLSDLLESMTNKRVTEWKERLAGMTLDEKVEQLKHFYFEKDDFMEVEKSEGAIYLIENNCPVLNIVSERPAVCSVTISTFEQLLGYEVKRIEKFQDGDRRCIFRVDLTKPIDLEKYEFHLE